MKYGFVSPLGEVKDILNLAVEAEVAGWDGFFMAEPVWGVDPWVTLGAAAVLTQRIRLGTMLTPVSIRKPWKLAAESATLDQLSGGRVILSVGLGAPDTGFACFGEAVDRKLRAELLDEGLDILMGLWQGQPFNYQGRHYQVKETSFYPAPPPVQKPRIPVWAVGAWPSEKSMARVLRCDGLLPAKLSDRPDPASGSRAGQATPDDIRAMKTYIEQHRTAAGPFDIVVEGKTPGADPRAAAGIVRPWAEAGATWWIEADWEQNDPAKLVERLRQGPPGLS